MVILVLAWQQNEEPRESEAGLCTHTQKQGPVPGLFAYSQLCLLAFEAESLTEPGVP